MTDAVRTESELLFEEFLNSNGVHFEPVARNQHPTPDYLVSQGAFQIAVEVTSIYTGQTRNPVPFDNKPPVVHSKIVGDSIRREITAKRHQLHWARERSLGSLLLLFEPNNPSSPWQLEDQDFITAMYGEFTHHVNLNTLGLGPLHNGRNAKLRYNKATYISALGRLSRSTYGCSVVVFPNLYAEIQISQGTWPSCFELRQFEIEKVDITPP